MAEYVSGEQYQAMKGASSKSSKMSLPKNSMVLILVVVVLMGLSFYGGVAYQKGHQSKTTTATTGNGGFGSGSGGGFGGGRFGGQRPTFGQVTAISASSITVQNSRTGASNTLSITSSTQITDNGQTVTTSDIQTGDMVVVMASSSNNSQAARILVNPSFGGGGSGGGGAGASGGSFDGPPSPDSGSALTE